MPLDVTLSDNQTLVEKRRVTISDIERDLIIVSESTGGYRVLNGNFETAPCSTLAKIDAIIDEYIAKGTEGWDYPADTELNVI